MKPEWREKILAYNRQMAERKVKASDLDVLIASMFTLPYGQLKKMLTERGSNALIQLDGGVKLDNCAQLCEAGADVLVAGSAVFKDDPAANVRAFREILGKF